MIYTNIFIAFLIMFTICRLYFMDYNNNLILLFKNYVIEVFTFACIFLVINMLTTDEFDHCNFVKKYKPAINNLKQMHFYKRKTCVIKDGKIHRFKDNYS